MKTYLSKVFYFLGDLVPFKYYLFYFIHRRLMLISISLDKNNIVWQKSDGKPYLLDWDEMHKSPIKYEKNCYRKLLCDRKWQHIYGSYEELVDKFERMW